MHTCLNARVVSWHRVSTGRIGYRRCSCGAWSIVQERFEPTAPVVIGAGARAPR